MREHQQRHWPAYLAYLRAEEQRLRSEAREAWARFTAHEAKQRRFVERSGPSSRSLAAFAAEEQRLTRLQLFYASEPAVGCWTSGGGTRGTMQSPEPCQRAVCGRREGGDRPAKGTSATLSLPRL